MRDQDTPQMDEVVDRATLQRTEDLSIRLSNPTAEPTPSGTIPKYLVEGAQKQNADCLRRLAEYALQLAVYQENQARIEFQQRIAEDEVDTEDSPPKEWDEEEWEETVAAKQEEFDVPLKACIVTKEIDGNKYFYYNWREGGTVKSQYIAPVNPTYNTSGD